MSGTAVGEITSFWNQFVFGNEIGEVIFNVIKVILSPIYLMGLVLGPVFGLST